MAASLPGVTLVRAGWRSVRILVLGLSPDQTHHLNGLNFGGSNLPRDANVSTSLVTTPYDVSRGGFSGRNSRFADGPVQFITRTMSLISTRRSSSGRSAARSSPAVQQRLRWRLFAADQAGCVVL